jgi:hypothetical protein
LIQERLDKFKEKEVLESINHHKLSKLFLNIVKGLNDLKSKGVNIKYLTPSAVLANMETGEIKLILDKSAVLKESPLTLLDTFNRMHPNFDVLRYLSPEALDNESVSHSSLSWSIGIML